MGALSHLAIRDKGFANGVFGGETRGSAGAYPVGPDHLKRPLFLSHSFRCWPELEYAISGTPVFLTLFHASLLSGLGFAVKP